MADSIAILKKLVEFDTTSRHSNMELINFIADYLEKLGVKSELIYSDDKKKANLFATLGPSEVPGIVLSGHTDVVPVDGQPWDTDPFTLVEKGDRLYGRGTSDMKAFIAICLALAPDFLAQEIHTPLHFAFSYDEEIGCIGVRKLLAELNKRPVKPKGCIVGEPTSMKVVRAHKGKEGFKCDVRGKETHSALNDQGVNAVEFAALAVSYLRNMQETIHQQGPFDDELSPPYTTIHTGVIHGGTALNIIPLDCTFLFEFRNIPDHDYLPLYQQFLRYVHETLEPKMKAISQDCGFTFEHTSSTCGLNTPKNSEIVQLALQLTGENSTAKVSFGTEAGLFDQTANIPAVICGPGNIAQAHQPNEWIEIEQIRQCERVLNKLVELHTH